MDPRLDKFLRGDRKYFTIVFLVLLLLMVSAFVTPVLIEREEESWKQNITGHIRSIEQEIISEYKEEEDKLLISFQSLKTGLRGVLDPGNVSYGNVIGYVSSEGYHDFAIEVYAPNGRLIAWNKNAPVQKELPFPLAYPAGETHFISNGVVTYLSIIDTIDFDSDHFYLILSLPFQKNYKIHNGYFEDLDFTSYLSDKLLTKITINYSKTAERNRDGRYSFVNIINNKGSRIASVSFQKPLLDNAVNSIKEKTRIIQGLLLIFGYLIFLFAFRRDFKSIKFLLLKFLAFAAYLAGFRVLLYLISFPSILISGEINDPSLFSSTFAWGMVRSPVEFLVTLLFGFIIILILFKYLKQTLRRSNENKTAFLISLLPAAFLYLMTSRGLYAAVKSIIFDSSIRYFKSPEIIPGLPEMVMNFNLLLLGTIIIILLVSFVLVPLSFIHNRRTIFYWISFIVFQISGYLFVVVQNQPLITSQMQFIFISILFIVVWLFAIREDSPYNIIYFAIASSVISITLLNHFNLYLERESLKTTAMELNRPNDNLLNFLLRETLRTSALDPDVLNSYNVKNPNYTGVAFNIWSKSPLQRESLSSSVAVLDHNKSLLGEFKIGIDNSDTPISYFEGYTGNDIQIVEIEKDQYTKLFKGIVPFNTGKGFTGYISASVLFNLQRPVGADYPDFLASSRNIYNSVIDASQINIFEIFNSKLTNVYGDIYPSRDQIKPVIDAEYNSDGESWQVLELNNEIYLAYALRNIINGNEKITVVLHKEKQITWNLFNFFKIFLVHILYIFLFFLIIFISQVKKFRYTFRMQLLSAFLFISIIPVVILAIYNRQAVNERSRLAVTSELSERLEYIEKHVVSQMSKHKERDFNDAFANAAYELGISFNVYDNSVQTFSSKGQYYKSGLFNSRLNPKVHYQLNYLSFREYLEEQNIEKYNYSAFYKKFNLGGKELIIGVDDAFNKVRLSFTSADADILLFGVYSFAVIVIIIINTILANRISSPIRQLIRATGAVAQGDLSIKIPNKERGEIRDLIDGFNSMTNELQKNEAELAALERETAWKEMAKQVAHEIKNPLTPMKLAVQQMIISFNENKNFESIFRRVTETLLNQIENLNQIASEFSRFARMPHFKLEKINVAVILKDIANLFIDEKVRMQVNLEEEEAFIEGDSAQFRRLFINMTRNSLQSGANKISYSLRRCEEGYEIIIADNGGGILPENQSKIFDPDFTTKEKGMGLGLKLAKRFIEGIKGTISLVNSSSEGTTFRIYVPGQK